MLPSKARTAGLLALLTVLAAAAGACFQVDGFECGSDQGCTREGAAGRCEPEGVCSYPSEECPSQWRYSPNAGMLADACVPGGAQDGSSGRPAQSGTTSQSTDGLAPSSATSDGSSEPSCPGCLSIVSEGRVFFLCAEAQTWFGARDACSECGLELASVHSDAENQALASAIPETIQLWHGLTDTEVEGDWRWEDDSTLGFEMWAQDEPSTLAEDDCAVLVASGDWFAKRCDLPNPYACASPP